MQNLPDYAELHAISNFTFLRGASHPEELVRQAAALGYRAVALTDECSMAGVVRGHLTAQEVGLDLIVGSEIRLNEGITLVLLATDRASYGRLTQLITTGRRAAAKGHYTLQRDDINEATTAGCLALFAPGVPGAGRHSRTSLAAHTTLTTHAGWIAETFRGRSWLAVEQSLSGIDRRTLDRLTDIGTHTGLPLLATGNVHMHDRSRKALQDTLTAIRHRVAVHDAGTLLHANAEHCLQSRKHLGQLYPPELLAETLAVAERCRFSLHELSYQYPCTTVPDGMTATEYLRILTEQGANSRWPAGIPQKVRTSIEHELALIAELRYEAYFLTVYDIVQFARSQNILCQGRGSAANSAVCFCLGITEVDPARMDLLFERFVSRERNEPPDIDIDFEHDRREEVLQYIYKKYGREHAALTATVITYQPKSALRDVGQALGLNLEQVDRLAKNLSWWDGTRVLPERLQEVGFDPGNPVLKRVLSLVNTLVGFPRHLSQHVGGFVISAAPLSTLVPIENAAMPERTVIQWDKDDIDALGLLKVDCLGLGMLNTIHRAFDLIEAYRGERLQMATLPADDKAVYHMIQRADTIGVFQIESRAQMVMLPRLKPENFYDLVIEIAIVRPGPIQGEMVHPYLRRRQGTEAVTYPTDAIRQVLARTLGVPIFQEQVIKLAMVAAGFSAGEADGLRRSMAAWKRRGGLEHYQQRLIDGMRKRGYSESFAQRIFQQIKGFGEYGFPESHAASFALLAYVSAWLKCHEPAAFTCALLNSQPMGFYAPAQLVRDAIRHGVTVHPVDVHSSGWDSHLQPENPLHGDGHARPPALRLGMRLVKGLSRTATERLIEARSHAPYRDTDDLITRAQLQRGDIEALAAAGALHRMAGHRHRARWAAAGGGVTLPLWDKVTFQEGAPLLRKPTEGEDVVADYIHVGLTLGRHPMALLRPRLAKAGIITANEAYRLADGQHSQVAGLVITRQRPSSANNVAFITLEDETGHVNVIVWRRIADAQRPILIGARLMGTTGIIQREGDVLHVIAAELHDYSHLLGGLTTRSRDFR